MIFPVILYDTYISLKFLNKNFLYIYTLYFATNIFFILAIQMLAWHHMNLYYSTTNNLCKLLSLFSTFSINLSFEIQIIVTSLLIFIITLSIYLFIYFMFSILYNVKNHQRLVINTSNSSLLFASRAFVVLLPVWVY